MFNFIRKFFDRNVSKMEREGSERISESTSLATVVHAGDLKAVRKMLQQGADPNSYDS